jgi:hypothetical protein
MGHKLNFDDFQTFQAATRDSALSLRLLHPQTRLDKKPIAQSKRLRAETILNKLSRYILPISLRQRRVLLLTTHRHP